MNKISTFAIFSVVLALILYSIADLYPQEADQDGGEYDVSGNPDQEGTAIIPPEANEGTEIGEEAPNIRLKTLEGKKTDLNAYKGKPIILNIWATWCPPCKEEMPEMQKFEETFGDEVTILAVNATQTEDDPANAGAYIEQEGFTFETVLDYNDELSDAYQTFSIPTTYFIHSDGTIQSRKFGPMTYQYMTEKMKNLD
ncbi:TlpA disulfide reductase family protein [Salimicrobium sp. PL1-032A]|uniref:TlpA family protein disulfide reductase n=1 Tax=Salimicrobium sp. PL1-032A TaxID=3095364 RepID=UPI00326105E2